MIPVLHIPLLQAPRLFSTMLVILMILLVGPALAFFHMPPGEHANSGFDPWGEG